MRARTVSDEELLMFIDDFREKHGFAPTYRELSQEFGLVLSAIGYRIAQLRKEGLLAQVSVSSARTLVLSSRGFQLIGRSGAGTARTTHTE